VVITVSEVRGRGRLDVPAELRTKPAAAAVSRSPSDKPGVDLGALLRLISDCGGHLWITAEPPGNMTLKIHLPKRAPVAAVDPGAPARPPRGRSLARLFRH
jgi:hypothetical protein